ncbi:MAG: ABC transporter permease, partial [Actinomycetota bacterium]|nr:ABC transporter permease [Actinomycetota bacterium]
MTDVSIRPPVAMPPPSAAAVPEEDEVKVWDATDKPWMREGAWFLAILLTLVAGRDLLPSNVSLGIMGFGVVVGGLNALMAMALILIYRTNRIINFAQAEIGVFGAIFFQRLVNNAGWSYYVALPLGILASAALAGVIEYFFVRRFHKAPRLILTVATIGIAQVVTYATFILPRFGEAQVGAAATVRTPFYTTRWDISGFLFRGDALVALVALPLLVVVLNLFFRTRFGTASRAAAENSDRASLLGVPVKTVNTVLWIVAGLLVGVATSLRVPLLGVSVAASGPGFMLRALAAAVIARMESLKVAVMAAIILGIIEQTIFSAYAGSTITDAFLLAVIVGSLLLQKQITRRNEIDASSWSAVEEVKAIPAELRNLFAIKAMRWGIGGTIGALLVALPYLVSTTRQYQAQTIIVYAMVAVSLVVLTGWSGQVSLGQFAIVGFGAAVCSKLLAQYNWDFIAAMLVGSLAGALVAVVLGLVALKVKGFFFAATTLGFAVAVPSFFLNRKYFSWLVLPPFSRVERPMLLDRFDLANERIYYWFCLLMLAIVVLCVRSLRASRIGRILIAVRDNERAAQSYGISQAKAKLLTFALSGLIAGLAGAIYTVQQQVDPGSSANAYAPSASLQVFSMVVIGGLGSVPGAVLGAIYVRSAIYNLSAPLALLATGAGLLVILLVLPGGLGKAIYAMRDAALRKYAERRKILVPSLLADRREADAQTAAVERDVEEAMRRIAAERHETSAAAPTEGVQ